MILQIKKIDPIYEVRVESSKKLIGYFIPEVDGFFYFPQNNIIVAYGLIMLYLK